MGHGAAVGVAAYRGDAGLLPKAQPGQVLPRALPEGLPVLWRIDGGQAHPFHAVGAGRAAADGECVAVVDGDHQAEQWGSGHRGADAEGNPALYCLPPGSFTHGYFLGC